MTFHFQQREDISNHCNLPLFQNFLSTVFVMAEQNLSPIPGCMVSNLSKNKMEGPWRVTIKEDDHVEGLSCQDVHASNNHFT